MATPSTTPAPYPLLARPLLGDADLALELAEAFHLVAQCMARGLRVPDATFNDVDHLLERAHFSLLRQENAA